VGRSEPPGCADDDDEFEVHSGSPSERQAPAPRRIVGGLPVNARVLRPGSQGRRSARSERFASGEVRASTKSAWPDRRSDRIFMTMKPKVRTMTATAFKARCLSVLDEVESTRRPVVVSKRGRPVARIVPAQDSDSSDLRGSVIWAGDLVSPVGDDWEADQ
jgi:prevent-host-death family protein